MDKFVDNIPFRLLSGDCLERMKELPDESVDAIIADPPYGIDYQSAWLPDQSKWKPKIANDKSPYIWWLKDAFRVLKPNSGLLCFTRYDTESDFRWAMKLAGFTPKSQIIWDKGLHGMGDLKGDFAPQHENLIFATKGKFAFPGKRPSSVISVSRIYAAKLVHPNEKPIELMRQLIEAITPAGGTVLDPFMGAGSSAQAAALAGFNFIGIEMEPTYVEIARQRVGQINTNLGLAV